MKNFIISFSVVFFLLVFNTIEVRATTTPRDSSQLTPSSMVMLTRLEEIKAMDMSTLSRKEKKALRKELRDMEDTASNSGNGGVFVSIGGLVIIILLLIIFF